jgi:hypothetical protein
MKHTTSSAKQKEKNPYISFCPNIPPIFPYIFSGIYTPMKGTKLGTKYSDQYSSHMYDFFEQMFLSTPSNVYYFLLRSHTNVSA